MKFWVNLFLFLKKIRAFQGANISIFEKEFLVLSTGDQYIY